MLHVDCWSDCKSCCIKLTHFIIYILSIIQHSTTTAKTITYASHIARLVILWVKIQGSIGAILGCPGGDWGSPGPVSGLGFQHAAEPPGGHPLRGTCWKTGMVLRGNQDQTWQTMAIFLRSSCSCLLWFWLARRLDSDWNHLVVKSRAQNHAYENKNNFHHPQR